MTCSETRSPGKSGTTMLLVMLLIMGAPLFHPLEEGQRQCLSLCSHPHFRRHVGQHQLPLALRGLALQRRHYSYKPPSTATAPSVNGGGGGGGEAGGGSRTSSLPWIVTAPTILRSLSPPED